MTSTSSPRDAAHTALVRRAFRLEYLTLGWMIIEGLVAVTAGIAAHSLTLLAFGADSLIELLSALVLLWRLVVELRRGRQDFPEEFETLAARIAGGLLLALAAYVVSGAAWNLGTRQGAAFSISGLVLALVAMPLMIVLARRKRALADAISSRALRADAAESTTCAWLSGVVVVALLAQAVFGAWWVDALGALGVVWFLVREGLEAFGDDDD